MGQRMEGETQASGPGATLAAARKAAGRQLEDISIELCIGQNHLESIERNNFDGMGGPTYVKGYLRAYARTLGLDPETIIAQYLEQNPQEVLVQPRRAIEPAPAEGKGKLIGMAVVAALLVAALLAWFLRGDSETSTPSPPTSEAGAPSVSSAGNQVETAPVKTAGTADHWIEEAPPLPSAPSVPGGAAQKTEPVTKDDAGASEQKPQSSAQSDKTSPVTQTVADKTPPATDTSQSAKPGSDKEKSTADSAPAKPKKTARQSQSNAKPAKKSHTAGHNGDTPIFVGTGKDTIELNLKQDSWVQIQDNTGAVLLQGLYTAGAVRKIQGEAPFQVFLGNAPGVTVRFNGKPFDSSSYVRSNNTARFALVPE